MRGAGRAGVPAAGVILAGLVLVALALRIPLFDDALFGDELSTNFVVHGFGRDSLMGLVGSDQEGTPPLYFVLAWLVRDLGGHAEALRIVPLLSGLAAIPLTYALGRRTVGEQAAWVGAAVVAVTPFLIYYSVEARAYAPVMVLCLIAALCLVHAVEEEGLGWWAGFAVSLAAAAYTHYTAIFVLAGMFAWAFFAHPGVRGPLLLAGCASVALYLPWLGEFSEDSGEPASQVIEALHPLTWENARRDVVAWAFGLPLESNRGWPEAVGPWLARLGLLAGAAGFAWRWWTRRAPRRPSAGVVLILILAIATPVGAVLHDVVAPSTFVPRNLIASSPGLALLFGAIVTASGPRLRYAATALLLGGLMVGAVKLLDPDHQRPDYAAAVSYLEDRGATTAPVVEVTGPTPGPQSLLEAEWAGRGEAVPPAPEIAVVGLPSIEERLEARGDGPPEILDPLPAPSSEELARRAAAEADAGGGTIFMVVPGSASLERLRGFGSPVAPFLDALPDRFRGAEARTFPGHGPNDVSVYVLRDDGAQPAP